MPEANTHASAVLVGDRGLIVKGPSGSGKTALCLGLLRHCAAVGRFARLVGDDRLFLHTAGGRLVARAAPPIAGLAEVRGYRPSPVAFQPLMVVDAMVLLVAEQAAPRFGEAETERLLDHDVPCLRLPERDVAGGVSAVLALFGLPPFSATMHDISAS